MILHDVQKLLQGNGRNVATLVLSHMTESINALQVEPEDPLDMILTALDQQSRPVLVVLPETGTAFTTPADFHQLWLLLQEGRTEDVVGFVIPVNRLGTIAKYAHQYHFLFSASPEKVIQSYLQRKQQTQQEPEQGEAGAFYEEEQTGLPKNTDSYNSVQISRSPVANPITPFPPGLLPEAEKKAVNTTVAPRKRYRRARLAMIAVCISLLVLVAATFLTSLFTPQAGTPGTGTSTLAGVLSFSSSGQMNQNGSTGLNDQISLDLHIAPPGSGNSYYAWLLPDPGDDTTLPLLLGALTLQSGEARFTYQSPGNTDLLATYSGFRVTEQSSATVPTLPSANPAAWRLVGQIPSVPSPSDLDHFSLLNHMRHLLAKDPTLQAIGLNGGLDTWLFRNTGNVLEDATAARDDWNQNATDLLRWQVIRVLDYLDGINYAPFDVPAGTPFLLDQKIGHIGLLTIVAGQNPPGYLAHVDLHLQGLAKAPGHTAAQEQLAIQIDQAINTATTSLQHIRQDAKKLLLMSNQSLQQQAALSLLNDMVTNATLAYAGQLNPATGENTGGIVWVHEKLQGLAMIQIFFPSK